MTFAGIETNSTLSFCRLTNKFIGENPADYIVPLMRTLRDDHPFFYQNAKRFIEHKYEECFPGQNTSVSPGVMERLKEIAEGGTR